MALVLTGHLVHEIEIPKQINDGIPLLLWRTLHGRLLYLMEPIQSIY